MSEVIYDEVVTLRNKTQMPKAIVHDGRQHVIQGHEEASFEAPLAMKFMQMHPSAVDRVDMADVLNNEEDSRPDDEIWIANMTGDPDAPEMLTGQRFDRVTMKYDSVNVPNPIKDPRPVKLKALGSERFYIDKNGEPSSTLSPAQLVHVEPYQIKKYYGNLGRWALKRAKGSALLGAATLIRSRPYPEFRPTSKWELSDIHLWLKMCKPDIPIPKTEKQLKANPKKTDIPKLLHDAKLRALRQVFFCIANPKVVLPSKEDFEDFKAGGKSPKQAQVDKIAEARLMGEVE